MKDYRRAGAAPEQFAATLLTYAKVEPLPIHGRLGCVHCAIEISRFFIYKDMLVCIYCHSRYALRALILPELTHLSQRLVCARCHSFHFWVESKKLFCKCGHIQTTAAKIKPVPLFPFFELPEPVNFGMNAKSEIKKAEARDAR